MDEKIKYLKMIIESALMAAGEPLTIERLQALFDEEEKPSKADVKTALDQLATDFNERSIELQEVASGFCFRVKKDYASWVNRLWDERPPKYSRALLETLALVAYRQPITRGEIEKVRGVAVSTHIIKTLADRNWIRIVGHRDIPGKPSLYATTKEFLDYFSLKTLDELPSLAEIKDLDKAADQLELELQEVVSGESRDVNISHFEEVESEADIDAEVEAELDNEYEDNQVNESDVEFEEENSKLESDIVVNINAHTDPQQ